MLKEKHTQCFIENFSTKKINLCNYFLTVINTYSLKKLLWFPILSVKLINFTTEVVFCYHKIVMNEFRKKN